MTSLSSGIMAHHWKIRIFLYSEESVQKLFEGVGEAFNNLHQLCPFPFVSFITPHFQSSIILTPTLLGIIVTPKKRSYSKHLEGGGFSSIHPFCEMS